MELVRGKFMAHSVPAITDAQVTQFRASLQRCHDTVFKGGGNAGYTAKGKKCTGLTQRLINKVMPHLNDAKQAYNAPWYVRKRRGGSSVALGKRIDKEVYHLITCVHMEDPTIDVQRLAALGSPLPRVQDRSPGKLHTCARCGLSGVNYSKRTPGWHKWTRAYLSDCYRYGMRLVASQVPVAWPLCGVATELDDVAIDSRGRSVVIERKSGYQDATGKPKSSKIPKAITLPVMRDGLHATVVLPNTHHTLHRLQAAVGMRMLAHTAQTTGEPEGRSCVAYVTGKSRAPAVGSGRDLDGSLECVWLWNTKEVIDASAFVLDAL